MASRRNQLALKAVFCLVLCVPPLAMDWRNAQAQTPDPTPHTVSDAATLNTTTPSTAASSKPAPPEPQPVLSVTAGPKSVNRISMVSLIRHSDPIVQGVMALLLLCSIFSWAAFIYKSFTLAIARRNTSRFSRAFQSAATMDDAGSALGSVTGGAAWRMWLAAKQEWDATLRATGTPLAADQTSRLLQRLALAMGSAQERSLTRLGNWMGLLATIGSTAPFIGLFGTVWGILDSFEHISASYNTSLTVVAPGIAEALLATAVGLFTAIPATMFYNRFAREVGKITGMLDNVTAELVVFASRDVERLHK